MVQHGMELLLGWHAYQPLKSSFLDDMTVH